MLVRKSVKSILKGETIYYWNQFYFYVIPEEKDKISDNCRGTTKIILHFNCWKHCGLALRGA